MPASGMDEKWMGPTIWCSLQEGRTGVDLCLRIPNFAFLCWGLDFCGPMKGLGCLSTCHR